MEQEAGCFYFSGLGAEGLVALGRGGGDQEKSQKEEEGVSPGGVGMQERLEQRATGMVG